MRERMGLGIGVALASATLLVVTLMYAAAAMSAGAWRPWNAPPDAVRWDEVAKISLPAAALIFAVVGAVIAAYGHQARLEELALSRDSDVTDRYTRAVEQLGNGEQLAVRLGGIYALERIHHDSERDRSAIQNLLHTFVSTNAERRPGDDSDPEIPALASGADVAAALQTLGRLETHHVKLDWLSLVDIDLTGARFPGCRGVGAVLSGATLYEAELREALFIGANFAGSNLRGADLVQADLTNANLSRADLSRANLDGANLDDAWLVDAVLDGAYLRGATFTRANFTEARLRRAMLTGARLEGADLTGARLTRANLAGADLTNADLTSADLTGVDLSDVNVEKATWSKVDPPVTDWPALVALIRERRSSDSGH
jgi:uncharacterized protein YjbI with pentapeptide repeats